MFVVRSTGRVAGVWHAPAASALVEQHDSVRAGVEVSTHTRGTSGAWAAVKDDGGLAVRASADLPVHEMSISNVEHALFIWLDLRI